MSREQKKEASNYVIDPQCSTLFIDPHCSTTHWIERWHIFRYKIRKILMKKKIQNIQNLKMNEQMQALFYGNVDTINN